MDFLGQLHNSDGVVSAGDHEASRRELDIGDGGFEDVRGDLLALLDHLGGGFHDRSAAMHGALGAARAAAVEEAVAVALHQPDRLERDAEPLAEDLRKRRSVAHAEIERAGEQRDRSVALKNDAAQFFRWRRGHFEIAADAEPAQLAALAALAPTLPKTLGVSGQDCLLHHGGEVAAVISHAGGGLGRQLARADVVAPAQLQAIDAKLRRGGVDQPLHVVVALGTAGTAIGRDLGGVGEHALGRDLDQRRAIDVLHVLDSIECRRDRRHR